MSLVGNAVLEGRNCNEERVDDDKEVRQKDKGSSNWETVMKGTMMKRGEMMIIRLARRGY